MQGSYFSDLFVRNLTTGQLFSAMKLAVCHILFRCSPAQMLRVYASKVPVAAGVRRLVNFGWGRTTNHLQYLPVSSPARIPALGEWPY